MSVTLDDFVNGLLRLVREAVRRNLELVKRIDGLFLVFTPREVETLLGSVTIDEAARAYAWESWLFREIERHGVLR